MLRPGDKGPGRSAAGAGAARPGGVNALRPRVPAGRADLHGAAPSMRAPRPPRFCSLGSAQLGPARPGPASGRRVGPGRSPPARGGAGTAAGARPARAGRAVAIRCRWCWRRSAGGREGGPRAARSLQPRPVPPPPGPGPPGRSPGAAARERLPRACPGAEVVARFAARSGSSAGVGVATAGAAGAAAAGAGAIVQFQRKRVVSPGTRERAHDMGAGVLPAAGSGKAREAQCHLAGHADT